MDMKKPIFVYKVESPADKFSRKSKEAPVFPLAIAGFLAAAGVGAYKFNKRGKMSPSVYLIELRLLAQGVAVGAIALGMLYSMVNEHLLKKTSLT